MKVKWLGTATLLIEGADGTRVLLDPYLRQYEKKTPPVPLEEARGAEAILITHPHSDHFADVDAFSCGKTPVYVSARGLARAQAEGFQTQCMRTFSAGDRFSVGGLTVHAYQSRHCSFDAATVLRIAFSPHTYVHFRDCIALLRQAKRFRIPKEEIVAFEIEDEARRIVVLGSAGVCEGVRYPQGADLLVFPYQGRARMHRVMQPIVRLFRPKAVMLDHFDNAFPPITHRVKTKAFIPALHAVLPQARAIVPQRDVWYEV